MVLRTATKDENVPRPRAHPGTGRAHGAHRSAGHLYTPRSPRVINTHSLACFRWPVLKCPPIGRFSESPEGVHVKGLASRILAHWCPAAAERLGSSIWIAAAS